MPELPEVETVVRGLKPELMGAVADQAAADWLKVLDGWSLEDFNERIRGLRFENMHRRGKYICITLTDWYLVIHLRMTGRLYMADTPAGTDAWVRFSLALADGRYLVFSDSRKFGRVRLSDSLTYLDEKLGPEPLELEDKDYVDILSGSTRAVKVFLLDQKKLAGVGNIYADESLFRAGIHPTRPVKKLTKPEKIRLGGHIKDVLAAAINHEGATISWYRKPDGTQGESQKHFQVYGRGEDPCYQCGTPIRKIVLGQRGTHFCPKCQK